MKWMTSPNLNRTALRIGLIILLLLPARMRAAEGPRPNAKDDLAPLVQQLTSKFDLGDRRGIVVMDLQPSFGESDSFGPWLADQISAAIGQQEASVEMIDRKRLHEALQAGHMSTADQWEVRKAVPLGKSIGATTVVIGSYGAADRGIGITLVGFRVSEMQSPKFMIGMFFGKIPLTGETAATLKVSIESLKPSDGIYRSGLGGVSVPTCVKCPVPQNMHIPDIDIQGMLRAHPQGATVWLQFIVTEDGRTRDVKVLQPVGFGFDEQYAKAAQDWEFNPAVDADGKRRAVKYVYHVSFNFK